ncbi:MAG: ABC transporter substrate-binding protein, partial [Clostridiales bacterium]|nr:ABC transporter substrate-binding protein [Clostridiales bacterium]
MRKKLSAILAALMLLSALSSCAERPAPVPAVSPAETTAAELSDFVFGVYNFTKIDPADKYNGWGTIRYGVGETLFRLDDSLNIVPVLVTAHQLSEDNMTWTLTLRDGVLFHNGKPMDGAAVKKSLERLLAINERAAADLMIADIAADGNTVIITTAVPNPTLLNALCDPYACIVDADADDGTVDFNMYPVCTGPYIVKDYTLDVQAYLEPFDEYWGGTPKLKSVTVKAISDVDTLSLAMQNGEIDAAYGLSYDTLPIYSDNSQFKVSQAATTRVYMLYFNLGHEFMNDENFRRAVCMAVDKASYGSVLLGGAGTPTKAAFPSSLSYGDDSLMTGVPDYDPEGARALLTENGYIDTDGDGFVEKDGRKVSLKLITYGRAGLPQSAQALQSALTELGVATAYEQVDSVETYLKADDFDICAYAY